MVELTNKIKFSSNSEFYFPENKIKKSFKIETVNINSDNYLIFQIIHSFLFYSFTSEEFIKLYNEDLIYDNSELLITKINEIINKIKKNIIIQSNSPFTLNQNKLDNLEKLAKIIKLSYLKIHRDKIEKLV